MNFEIILSILKRKRTQSIAKSTLLITCIAISPSIIFYAVKNDLDTYTSAILPKLLTGIIPCALLIAIINARKMNQYISRIKKENMPKCLYGCRYKSTKESNIGICNSSIQYIFLSPEKGQIKLVNPIEIPEKINKENILADIYYWTDEKDNLNNIKESFFIAQTK